MHKQQQIAMEAGKSFISVVKDYAGQGHSVTETGILLGYGHSAFWRLCKRQGWLGWFAKGEASIGAKRAREIRKGQDTPAMRAARNRVSYATVTVDGIADTYAGHARRLGIPVRTIYSRKRQRPDDLEYIFATRSHVRPPKSNRGHTWRKG